tara:strand:+ start:2182 stop:2949 length:768 start_codon:yes stop_codon:yes gene_type:complete
MKKSVISHFYNEEYLLPWWLKHHKKYFDYGLMINYASTDRSVEIIKEICPDWQIVDSVNKEFDTTEVDNEVFYYEKQIPGWKIAINATEFLIGDFNLLDTDTDKKSEYYIPTFYFVDDNDSSYPDEDKPLYEQVFNGIDYLDNRDCRRLRCMHNSVMSSIPGYVAGRHFYNFGETTDKFIIFNYGFAPMNEHLIKRKLQIQHRFSRRDIERNWGWAHHNHGKGLTKDSLFDLLNGHRLEAKNLSSRMEEYLEKYL